MTQNAWPGLDYVGDIKMGYVDSDEHRERRFRALVQEIRAQQADVVSINEANILPGFAKRLARELGYDYIYDVSDSGVRIGGMGFPINMRSGDVILARKDLKLRRVGRRRLSGGPQSKFGSFNFDDGTEILVGRVSLGGKDIFVATTHPHSSVPLNGWSLGLMDELKARWSYSDGEYSKAMERLESESARRRSEFDAMAAYLRKIVPAGAALVLMGDFNAEADWPEMRSFFEGNYRDTYALANGDPGFTWDAECNDNIKSYYKADLNRKFDALYDHLYEYSNFVRWRIDFILANMNIPVDAIKQSMLCGDTIIDGVHPSDHFGVISTIGF